jgi:Ca-activated chloride channel family protein
MAQRSSGGLMCAALAATVLTLPVSSAAAPPAEVAARPDRCLAPYFMVPGADGSTEALPLKQTSAEVAISGVIARVKVHQLFENTGRKPIEAVYVFPASTRAAVHGMRMKIGERVVDARIERRAHARQAYEAARQEGQRASLLEQERPNVFTMNVANIMPGDKIAVELDYSEMIVPEDAVYEFVYPTVVGPRYSGGADPVRDRWIANPTLRAGTPEPYRFDIKVHVETGIPLRDLSSPSHGLKVQYGGPTRADVRLTAGGGNRDFVLRYRLADERIQAGVLLWESAGAGGAREQFFAMMLEPPQRPAPGQIPPREYIFLLDVSGSMHGFPLDTAKALMRKLLESLRPIDSFNVVLFSGASHTLSPAGSQPATPGNVARALEAIDRQQGGGGTELMGGLEACYRMPRADRHVSRTVVVVTDGYVGVEAQSFRFIRERLDQANLFAFGIGSSVNRGLIEGMARAGQGEPFVVLHPDKAAGAAEQLRLMIEQPVLTRVSVKFDGFEALDVAPAKLPDLMARRPLVLFGKYQGPASGRIEVSGVNGAGRFHQTLHVRAEDVRAENTALRWLWARKRVEELDDDRTLGADRGKGEEAITALGLGYKLLTAFTSFVAVDSQVVNKGGQGTSIRQPLPMPEGVSDLAVGGLALRGVGAGGSGESYVRAAGAVGVRSARAPKPMDFESDVAPGAMAPESRMERPAPRPAAAPAPSKAEAKPALQLQVTASQGLVDVQPLLGRLRALLEGRLGRCLSGPVNLKLRLVLDGSGRITTATLLAGDRALHACLQPRLLKLRSPSRPQGATGATVELTIQRS